MENNITLTTAYYSILLEKALALDAIKNLVSNDKYNYGYSESTSKAIDALLDITRDKGE